MRVTLGVCTENLNSNVAEPGPLYPMSNNGLGAWRDQPASATRRSRPSVARSSANGSTAMSRAWYSIFAYVRQSSHVSALTAPESPSIPFSATERDWPQVMQTARTWFHAVAQSEQWR